MARYINSPHQRNRMAMHGAQPRHGGLQSHLDSIEHNMDKGLGSSDYRRAIRAPQPWQYYFNPAGVTSSVTFNIADNPSLSSVYVAAGVNAVQQYHFSAYFSSDGTLDASHRVCLQNMYFQVSPFINNAIWKTLISQACTFEMKISSASVFKCRVDDIPIINRFEDDRIVGVAANPEKTQSFTSQYNPEPLDLWVNDQILGITVDPGDKLYAQFTFPSGWASTLFVDPVSGVAFPMNQCWFALKMNATIAYVV